MEQKKFMDIVRLKIGDEISESNCGGFHVGDEIVIQEKVDNSNASIQYDVETKELVAFSRKKRLDYSNTLNGFWNYVRTLNPEDYADTPNYVIFGEWSGARNTIIYNDDQKNKWYVYDIYDCGAECYLPQKIVKKFAEDHGLIYVHTLYVGPFISWDHCKTFCHSPAYGDMQEGIVCKNQSQLNNPNLREPFYLKIVNESFSEIKKDNHIRKVEDPGKLKEKALAQEIVDTIVTRRRIEKELHKMMDEGLLPSKLSSQDMRFIAQNLPKRIYEDCMKEEPEYVKTAGEYFGKMCGSTTMRFAKEIVLGE